MENTSTANISKVNVLVLPTVPISRPEGIAWCISFSLLSIFIVVGNLLTIILFVVKKRVRKKSLYFVISMASADLMLGTLGLPLYVQFLISTNYYRLSTPKMNWTLVYVSRSSYKLSLFVSLTSAALISYERFYAIHFPFKHRTKTTKGYNTVIFIMWTLSPLWEIGSAFQSFETFERYISPSYGAILTVIICRCNFAIWRKFNTRASHQNTKTEKRKICD